ncbi:uncharacterized protein LOC127246914 isoform X2 [Andrographis paniculata]|nr:uncharacterized protein LOC127246914 isoform X2 [Andrographis paniculata]
MDGVNILASGFEKDEKVEISKMVTAMGGVLLAKASSDVNFVIVKNVLAQKYKWALNNLKKPIVTQNWLSQCWKEHRVVPQDAYRVLPFSGLIICVSGIPADERKEIEKLAVQHGGSYSGELTKRCTHLICDAPEGDKYKVAKRWGHISIVTRKWFHQSIARKACLNEESYPVQGGLTPSMSTKTMEQHSQGKGIRNPQHSSSSMATALDMEPSFLVQDTESDLEYSMPNIYPTFAESPQSPKEGTNPPCDKPKSDLDCDPCVADDSQSEDDALYLSECRILLVGFDASALRKLVDMVRRGGGSRYTSFSEKLTHVLVGNPSDNELKEIRSLAALGVTYVVKTTWLEECTQKKKEVPVLKCHIAYDVLLPKDPVILKKTTTTSMIGVKQGKSSASQSVSNKENGNFQSEALCNLKDESKTTLQSGVSTEITALKPSMVFKGMLFRFSSTFPEEQRSEIVLWVNQGGGEVIIDQNENNVNFIVERHGVPCLTNNFGSTYITTHWIYSCLEDGCMLDVSSHILYSPLSCQVPLPGFERHCLCVSMYDKKEKQLLRNLCYVLGVKFVETLKRKKVTHLLCKFTHGEKYAAACKWGIPVATAEWLYECVKQNKVVDSQGFHPKEPTPQDQEAGLHFVSQFTTQSATATSADNASQNPSLFQGLGNMQTVASMGCVTRDDNSNVSSGSKRKRLSGTENVKHPLPCVYAAEISLNKSPSEKSFSDNGRETSMAPDVAAAIEDLLEQTRKIQDRKPEETTVCHENFLSSTSTMLAQRHVDPLPDPGEPSKHWTTRLDKKNDDPSTDTAARGIYDGFSETQTDSQVVGYEEDLSGRQMIIDRVRTRSSMA